MTDFGGSKTQNERDYWQTPIEIFNGARPRFGFWLDAAASESNALCAHCLTELDDSLNSEWTSCGAIWCNRLFRYRPVGRKGCWQSGRSLGRSDVATG